MYFFMNFWAQKLSQFHSTFADYWWFIHLKRNFQVLQHLQTLWSAKYIIKWNHCWNSKRLISNVTPKYFIIKFWSLSDLWINIWSIKKQRILAFTWYKFWQITQFRWIFFNTFFWMKKFWAATFWVFLGTHQ